MELSKSPHSRPAECESARDGATAARSVSLYLRLWTYGGPSQPLSGLPWQQKPEIAELIRGVIRDSKGQIPEPQQSTIFSARFDDALIAVAAAKALQQRFLTYHRKTEPQQVVPCVLICEAKNDAVSGLAADTGSTAPEDMLANVNSARILIGQSIYEQVKSAPGFQFNPKPVCEAGQTGDPEAIYELLWTDESTYGHLRKSIRTRLNTVGRYQIQEELGRGATGAVYKAYDQLIGRTVALKIISIDRNTPDRDEVIERLKQEAKAAGKLDHPNIITIYDVGEEDDLVYLSMQFLEGKTLLTLLAESGVPPLPTLISWADQISSAAGYAHAHGVIHRDLKPANLMLTKQGIIKILDFGIAKVENTTLTQTGLVVGTPSHMAPEQVAGKKVDQRTDIFALGSVFYELVTREKPFRGDVATILYKIVNEDPVPPALINPALPGGIDAIIRKALAKDPKDRFQTCEEMRNAFLEQASLLNIRLATPVPAGASAVKAAPRPATSFSLHLLDDNVPPRSMRLWPVLAGIVAMLLIGTTSWAFYTWAHTGSSSSVVKKLVAAVHRISAQNSMDGRPDTNAPQQPNAAVTGQPMQNGSTGDDASTGTSSPPQLLGADSAAGGNAATNPEVPVASGTTSQEQAPAQPSVSHPLTDGAHAPAAATAPASANATVLEPQSSTVTVQPVSATSSPAIQQSLDSRPAVEDASSASNGPASKDSSKAAADASREENQTGAPASSTKQPKKARREPALIVDGFTRHDVPELLREAEAAEARGDYRLARYSYGLILKLEPSNPLARSRLQRLQTAQQSH
jgi:eukaryotic-like serine/threonine-protein kinase